MVKITACTIRPKRLSMVFGLGDRKMNSQIVRLVVLYEDLRIEVAGSEGDSIEGLDETGAQYRKLYFLRRAFATVLEITGAIVVLEKNDEFQQETKRFFNKEDAASWLAAVKFFQDNKKFLKAERNLYGGHFHDDAATFAVENLSSDHMDILEILFPQPHKVRVVFRFALEFVGVAFTANKGTRDFATFIHENFTKIREAQQHATTAVQIIAKYYILPRWGVTSYPQLP